MVFIEGGVFRFGCMETDNDCHDNEKPSFRVELDNYYISKHEVTIAQFHHFISETGYITDAERKGYSYEVFVSSPYSTYIREDGATVIQNTSQDVKVEIRKKRNWRHDEHGHIRPQKNYNHPVINITWSDANKYCEWLSQRSGRTYRLPTEAEWEFAANNGFKTEESSNRPSKYPIMKYPGSIYANEVAWHGSNSSWKIHPVGEKKSNLLGIFDMAGNVFELCSDWYEENHSRTIDTKTDNRSDWSYFRNQKLQETLLQNPFGPQTGTSKVIKGGSWLDTFVPGLVRSVLTEKIIDENRKKHNETQCRISYRSAVQFDLSTNNIGFRVVHE